MVVDRDREGLLRRLLADDVALQELVDLPRLGQVLPPYFGGLGQLLLDDLVAEIDALIADVDPGTGDELLDLLLTLPAEGALQQVTAVTDARHECRPQSHPAHPSGVPVVTVPAEHGHRGAERRSQSATCRWAVAVGAGWPRRSEM
jgi:hypothetical protein